MAPYLQLGRNPYDLSMVCGGDDCYPEEEYISRYLDHPEVRDLLGVEKSLGNFSIISQDVFKAFSESGDLFHQNQLYVAELLERGVRVLIYAGTYDWICNWLGNERWTLAMEWSGQKAFAAESLREWKVDGKLAGLTRQHGNFTFATINGAGHLAPHDKPKESLAMLNRWLAEEHFDG